MSFRTQDSQSCAAAITPYPQKKLVRDTEVESVRISPAVFEAAASTFPPIPRLTWCSMQDSNLRSPACRAVDLAANLILHIRLFHALRRRRKIVYF